jgi:hypothetical protein
MLPRGLKMLKLSREKIKKSNTEKQLTPDIRHGKF